MSLDTMQEFLDSKNKTKSHKQLTSHKTLLLPFLPESLLLTLDLLPLTTIPQFRGFHSIPPGWHFICTATNASFSIRHGLWFNVPIPKSAINGAGSAPESSTGTTSTSLTAQSNPPDDSEDSDSDSDLDLSTQTLLSFSWSPTLESLAPNNPLSSEDLRRLHKSTPKTALLPYLSTIPNSPSSPPNTAWARLTSRLSRSMLTHLTSSPSLTISSASTSAQDMESIPGLSKEDIQKFLKAGDGGDLERSDEVEPGLQFLGIDLKRTWREGAVGRERTDAARDRSWLLGEIVRKADGLVDEDGVESGEWGRGCLGELQLCFLLALLLGNYVCAQEWKRIVEVVLTARTILSQQEAFFVAFLDELELQLNVASEQAEEDGGFFDFTDGETGDGAWLRKLLVGFQEGLDEVFEGGEGGGEVRERLGRFEEWVQETKGWGFFRDERKVLEGRVVVGEDGERVQIRGLGGAEEWGLAEDDDEGPVVVDLGEAV